MGTLVAGIEEMMRKSGLGEIEAIRPARELFLDSRWKLGKMLAKMPRSKPGPKRKGDISRAGKHLDDLEDLGLDKNRAQEAQRIGTLPADEKAKAYAAAKADEVLPTISMLIDVARPYWYRANRKHRRKAIADRAALASSISPPHLALHFAPPKYSKNIVSIRKVF
jgi:hypothetical protein